MVDRPLLLWAILAIFETLAQKGEHLPPTAV